MSVAFYIVPKNEIEGFDHFVNGKAIGHASEETLNAICNSLGVKPLHDFISQDSNELAEFFEDEELAEMPQLEQQWFQASDGLATVNALLEHLAANPGAIANATAILEDLKEYQAVLKRFAQEDTQWYLALDF